MMESNGGFGALMQEAVKIKGAQQDSMKKVYNTWPEYLQHSLFTPAPVSTLRTDGSYQDRLQHSIELKEQGGVSFGKGNYEKAYELYSTAIAVFDYAINLDNNWKTKGIIDDSLRVRRETCKEEDRKLYQEIKQVKIALYLNLAACELKRNRFPECRQACEDVFRIEPDNVKALYRRALSWTKPASSGAVEMEYAMTDLQRALDKESTNKDVRKCLLKLKEEQRHQKKCDQKTFSGMFTRGNVCKEMPVKTQHEKQKVHAEMEHKRQMQEAEMAVDMLHQRGEVQEAAKLQERILASKASEPKAEELDFANPTAQMIQDAKEKDIDLNDPQVRKMLVQLQNEKCGKKSEEEESSNDPTDCLLQRMEPEQVDQLLLAEGHDLDRYSSHAEKKNAARSILYNHLTQHMDINTARTILEEQGFPLDKFKNEDEMKQTAQYLLTSRNTVGKHAVETPNRQMTRWFFAMGVLFVLYRVYRMLSVRRDGDY